MASSLHNCYGRDLFNNHMIDTNQYISPEEKGILYDTGSMKRDVYTGKFIFSCIWPKCNCPLSSVSGAFHKEKIDYIVQETIKNKKFKYNIRIN